MTKEQVTSADGSTAQTPITDGPIVLFDGVCNLCNGAVQFLIDHEGPREPRLRFAPLQSTVARGLLECAFDAERANALQKGADGGGDPDSIVLIEGTVGYTHSTAGLRIARQLRAPWRWLSWLLVFPRPLRDLIYRFIARHRYRWFGKADTCRVPTPDLKARFLA